MPTITLDKNYLLKLVGKKISDKELNERIPMLGTDLDKIDKDEIIVEVYPNRPDMLSEQGFARALSSFLGIETGLKKYEVKRSNYSCKVDKTLKSWPYVVTAIVKGLEFNDERIREIIQLQEKLHITHLRDRKKGGIGIYPMDKIAMPITFTSESLDKINFRPLESNKEMTGKEILENHDTGKKYKHILEGEDKYPIFLDANNIIMSMPPIINSHTVGKVDEKTRDVFVECTGTDLNALQQCLNIVITSLADMGGEIYSMDVLYKDRLVSPNLRPMKMENEVKFISLENSLNADYSILRSWLIPGLMEVLSKNKHHEYPQKIFEIGTLFEEDGKEESGIKEFTRLSVVITHNKVDFTEVKQVLDSLFCNLGLSYEIERVKHNSFIEGRVGRVVVNGKKVAYIGEVHPKVISNWDLELPVVALELNLSELMEVINS